MIESATLPHAVLRDLTRTGQPHLRPIYAAMSSDRVALFMVRQGTGRFDLRHRGPVVAIIGDDTDQALGPGGFHRKSVRRLAERVRGITVIASGIIPDVYATAAQVGVLGHSTLIVETRPEQEGAWMEVLRRAAPRTPFLLCTPFEGTA